MSLWLDIFNQQKQSRNTIHPSFSSVQKLFQSHVPPKLDCWDAVVLFYCCITFSHWLFCMEIKLKTSISIMYINLQEFFRITTSQHKVFGTALEWRHLHLTEVIKEQIRHVSFRRTFLLYDILICRCRVCRWRVSRFNNQSAQEVTDKPGAVRKNQHPTTIEEAIFKLSSVARPVVEGQLTQAMTETCKRIKITSPITSRKIKI